MAPQMSSTWTTGRQGLPSLTMAMRLVVHANAHRSLITMSNRMRGEGPYAVALRRNTGEKPLPAIGRLALDANLAFRIRGLRIRARGLVEEVAGAGAVDAARRGVDEAANTDIPAFCASATEP